MVTAIAPSRNSCLYLGDPASNRAAAFQAARRRLGLPDCHMQSYAEEPLAGNWSEVRLDSPGKSLELERHLLERGGFTVPAMERGRLWDASAWYRGLQATLEQLPPDWPYHNPPPDVLLLFDKRRCSRRLREAGLPVADSLATLHDAADLRRQLAEREWQGAFVKLFCGSSCSGSLAYQARRQAAFTTLERAAVGRYYNSRKVRRYTGRVADELIDWLCRQGAQVEEWLPKARLHNVPFDVRLVMIDGQPCHRVVRQGKTPMLGLHLGSRRGPWQELDWEAPEQLGRGVAALFPNCLHLGVDLLQTPTGSWRVIEVNAFGDLLPGLEWQGMDTYEWELRRAETRRREPSIPAGG